MLETSNCEQGVGNSKWYLGVVLLTGQLVTLNWIFLGNFWWPLCMDVSGLTVKQATAIH